MILTEFKIRDIVRIALLKENATKIKNIQDVIGDKIDGTWSSGSTDKVWAKWVEDHVDNIVSLVPDGGINKNVVIKNKDNAAILASLILNDPKKNSIDGVDEFISLYKEKYKDELAKEKADKDKEEKASAKRKENLNTGGKYVFMRGKNTDGSYPPLPNKKLPKAYFKFFKDDETLAIDKETGDLYQRLRNSGDNYKLSTKRVDVSKRLPAYMKESVNKLLSENFTNPGKVYMDLKKGKNIDDPTGVFANNKDKIQKIAMSQSELYPYKRPEIAKLDLGEHTFADEEELSIRFKQIDMSSGAVEAEKIMSAVGGTSHKTAAGAKKIVNLVLKPAVERFGKTSSALYYDKKGVSLSDAWKYIGTSETGKQRTAWSGHTLNSFIAPGHPFFDGNKSLGTLGISYFWPWMIEKRKEVESDPESYIGQKIMMPFSKEEIGSRSDIAIKDGVFSLNGRGGVPKGSGLKGFKAKSKKGGVSGAHMNVYSGGKLIGGNLSGTVKAISPRDGLHTIYFIMVEILPNKNKTFAASKDSANTKSKKG